MTGTCRWPCGAAPLGAFKTCRVPLLEGEPRGQKKRSIRLYTETNVWLSPLGFSLEPRGGRGGENQTAEEAEEVQEKVQVTQLLFPRPISGLKKQQWEGRVCAPH